MIDGILVIDKESGMTSYDVIRQLKRILPRKQKIGHGGTLDPFATGVLVVLLGKGTKLMESIHCLQKMYEVTGEFGYATDTQDVTGNTLMRAENTDIVSKEDLEEIIQKKFLGKISQIPPIYSAKKVNGERAYDLARKGNSFSLPPKEITVEEFKIVDYCWPKVSFLITCSTGTYVRTLVHDLGLESKKFATAISLRRLKVGNLDIQNAQKLASLTEENVSEFVLNLNDLKL